MNVIAFCILDSFTPVNLWQEVAWTVFASLGWLVSEHFRLAPGPFSGRMAAPAEVPGQNPDPCGRFVFRHVHRRRQHAERTSDVDRPIYRLDRYFGRSGGASDVSGELDSAKESSSSGYSRNDSRLGGGFNFDYSPVMLVQSDKRGYWRGETRQIYTGNGWSDQGGKGGYEEVEAGSRFRAKPRKHPKPKSWSRR